MESERLNGAGKLKEIDRRTGRACYFKLRDNRTRLRNVHD